MTSRVVAYGVSEKQKIQTDRFWKSGLPSVKKYIPAIPPSNICQRGKNVDGESICVKIPIVGQGSANDPTG